MTISTDEPKIPGKKPTLYKPTVRERVDDVIYREVGGEDLKPETRFIEDLGADSLDMTEMACALEDEFDLPDINDEMIDKFVFVEDAYRYIEKRVKA